MNYLAKLCIIAVIFLLGTSMAKASVKVEQQKYMEYACEYILTYNHFSKNDSHPNGVDITLTELYNKMYRQSLI